MICQCKQHMYRYQILANPLSKLFCFQNTEALRTEENWKVIIIRFYSNLLLLNQSEEAVTRWASRSIFRWATHLNMSLFTSVHPSVHRSVAHHISETQHHVIMIFGTHVKWWYLQVFFLIFKFFWFFRQLGV